MSARDDHPEVWGMLGEFESPVVAVGVRRESRRIPLDSCAVAVDTLGEIGRQNSGFDRQRFEQCGFD